MIESPVQVFSEFQKLEEVIVGRAYSPDAFDYQDDEELKSGLKKILTETEEDITELVSILEKEGVTVKRPETVFELGANNNTYRIDLQHFSYPFPNHPLMPRDTVFCYGNTIAETYTKSHSRFFENWSYYDIFKEYFEEGATWLAMPPVPIKKNPPTYREIYNNWLTYHAANFIKCGEHIIYSQPGNAEWKGKGTDAGLEWFKRIFGNEAKFIPAPCAGHIDGKIALIKPGVLVTWDKEFVPKELHNWEIIVADSPAPFPDHFLNMKKQRFYKSFVQNWLKEWIGYVDETVFDVNMFSISEDKVISVGYNKDVFQKLKRQGVECIPWEFRHQYFWDGAVHCLTLDVRRSGPKENYL